MVASNGVATSLENAVPEEPLFLQPRILLVFLQPRILLDRI
jgi:hypothetical protein